MRYVRACVVLSAVTALLSAGTGCSHPTGTAAPPSVSRPSAARFPLTVTDARGKSLTLKSPPKRIVSLVPSNTEILFALGAGDRIAGVSSADDYPPQARRKPSIGDVLSARVERILACNPDLIVAIGSLNQKPIEALERAHAPLLVLDPKTLPETYDSILLLGRATGLEARAQQVVSEMRGRIERVRQTAARAKTRPKVLMLYQTKPLYTSGPDSFISDMIAIAGGCNGVEKAIPTNTVSPEAVVVMQPDVIVCGNETKASVLLVPGWKKTVAAVKNDRFFTPEEGEATLVRPTPRLATGIENLARYLHPELFPKAPDRRRLWH